MCLVFCESKNCSDIISYEGFENYSIELGAILVIVSFLFGHDVEILNAEHTSISFYLWKIIKWSMHQSDISPSLIYSLLFPLFLFSFVLNFLLNFYPHLIYFPSSLPSFVCLFLSPAIHEVIALPPKSSLYAPPVTTLYSYWKIIQQMSVRF